MHHLRKHCGLLLALAGLAVCFTPRLAPAQAVTVAPDGVGEHLLFAYWSTAEGMTTLVSIHPPLGVRNAGPEDHTVVTVRVRSAAPDRNTVVAFKICLLPAASWTAALSAAGLRVVSAGGCDDTLHEPTPRRFASQTVPTPAAGALVSLGDTDRGWLEAWLSPTHALPDDTVGVPDNDFTPEHAAVQPLAGLARLVSPRAGFASSYQATALRGCGAAAGTAITPATDDGDGCWALGTGGPDGTSPLAGSAGGVWIRQALRGVTTAPTAANTEPAPALTDTTRDLLAGRWAALADENVTARTQLVLTFPVNHLLLEDRSADPVSVHVYDDRGTLVLRSVETTLPLGVNTCHFLPAEEDGMARLTCNGAEIGTLDATTGTFRLFNNTALAADETTARRRERPGLGHEDGGAQDPAESLGVLGLIVLYFEGTDGLQYDQMTPLRGIDIADDAANL